MIETKPRILAWPRIRAKVTPRSLLGRVGPHYSRISKVMRFRSFMSAAAGINDSSNEGFVQRFRECRSELRKNLLGLVAFASESA